ncbi:MAG TPA: amidohydrolase family protein, partial [Gaiellaceae bacterium]
MLPVEGPPIEDGAVAIEAGRIAAVGTSAELGRGRHFPEAAIVPGFVNAHTHLEYAVYAGFGDGLGDFSEWISLHIERKARIDWDDHVSIARAGAAECLASGVTTVGDCSYTGAAAVACAELGLRATVYLEVFGTDPDAALERFGAARARVEPAFSDRVRPGISPHAPYSTGIDVYAACAETGLPLATHVSESASELAYLRDGSGPWSSMRLFVQPFGTTGPRLLAEHGLLGPGLLAAHCVHVDEDEIELLAASGAAVVHCPRSNAFLGCGVAPLAALRRAGAIVALGTDSPASAPSFDLFEELRAAVAGSRAREQRADALSASEALELATLQGARALGLEAEVGSLVPGKRADLIVVSMEGS